MTEAGPEPAPGFLRRHRRHLGIAGTGTLLLIIGILLPAAAVSFLREIRGPGSAQTQNLTAAGPLTADSAGDLRLQITLDSFAPWDGNLRLHISGHRSCATVCTPLRVLFVSI